MRTLGQLIRSPVLPRTIRLDRERVQNRGDLVRLQTAQQADGAKVVSVKALGQTTQHGLLRVGGHPLDDQLMTRDPEGEDFVAPHQAQGLARHRLGGGPERWMAEGIHRVLVQGDGKLDEEVVDLAGQRGARPDLGRLPV